MSNEPRDNLIIITKVLAGIWFARNKRVWEGKRIDSVTTVEMSSKQKKAHESTSNSRKTGASVDKWEALEVGWLKLNVDASV